MHPLALAFDLMHAECAADADALLAIYSAAAAAVVARTAVKGEASDARLLVTAPVVQA